MASHLRKTFVSLIVIATLLVCQRSPAGAQSSTSDKAAAEALFDRGLALMKEGKYQEACERLEQSQSIERGIGTMLYLAECYEKVGKTASAWATFREAASWAQAAGQVERAEAGKRRAEKLEKSLARLTVHVPTGSRVDGLTIKDNGFTLQASVWGLALPVDPGMHRLLATAPGYAPWASDVKIEDRPDNTDVQVPALVADPNAVAVTPPATPPGTASAQTSPGTTSAQRPVGEAPSGRMSNLRIVGLAVGGAGVLALVGGAVAGGLAMKNGDAYKDRQKEADGGCDQKCRSLSQDAVSQATASTVLWSVGGALVAGGLITFLLAPKYQERRPDVAVYLDRQHAGVRVGGVF